MFCFHIYNVLRKAGIGMGVIVANGDIRTLELGCKFSDFPRTVQINGRLFEERKGRNRFSKAAFVLKITKSRWSFS